MRAGRNAILALAFSALVSCTSRQGLFSTAVDASEAMAEHRAAWERRHLPRQISRLQLLPLVREYDGRCITGEVNWEAVALDRRLDDFLAPARPIECIFVSRAWSPLSLPRAYFWTIALTPVSSDMMDVVDFRRQRETL